MHRRKQARRWIGLGLVTLGWLAPAAIVQAQEVARATSEVSGSVIVFPKVIWDGTQDTIIQIANTGNQMVIAHCNYVNAAPVNPSLPPSATNPPLWVKTDFYLYLTRQQPTMWAVSGGRRTQSEPFGAYGSGFDPGLVPPMPIGFQGELRCVQVDDSLMPLPANRLRGTATLRTATGDLAVYNGIALPANPATGTGNELELTLTPGNRGGAYAACPDVTILNHVAHGAPSAALSSSQSLLEAGACDGGNCPVNTELTLIPCGQDLENLQPSRVTLGFLVWDEFESRLSGSTVVDCWMNRSLAQISNSLTVSALGGTTRHTRLRPVPGQGGVLGVATESRFHSNGPVAVTAYNLHTQGNRFDGATQGENETPADGVVDTMRLPME